MTYYTYNRKKILDKDERREEIGEKEAERIFPPFLEARTRSGWK